MEKAATAGRTKSNEIRLTRVYDAPVKAVWDAWNDPERAAKWWGPRGFTITNHGKDLRPGGYWKYTMHGPDGKDYPNITKYFEVEKHKKLVYDHGATEDTPPLFRVTVLFTDLNGKTKMDMTMTLATPEAAEKTRQFIKKAGGNGTWDRLAEYLEKEKSGQEVFVIARSFDAPIEAVFDAWTDPKRLAQWLPPMGATMEFIRADIRPGGNSFYRMPIPGGQLYGRVDYLELERPARIVYKQSFRDEKENLGRHPMAPTFPATMLTVVQLAAESADRTRVTITWTPAADATAAEVETFVNMRASMTQGWTGSLDKLDDHLDADK